MSKLFKILLVCLAWMAMPFAAHADNYQFTDSGFEDWTGAKFDDKIQPKYWNFSNVEQMGVKKNFAHQTNGRSGYALKIQDQFVGVLGIGATSPGYVSLGHPWAYVSSLTTIEDATAGTYGGISWTNRPDSMVVWIKRYYDSSVENAAGDHTGDENFNLLYYAWSGTSRANSFKAKNLTCTDISAAKPEYCVDEESDIRQALDGNECGTAVQANQIAEGWYYEKKAYPNWTRIVVPIYYLNDDVPEKCNVILSAGRYPDFRANSGQNAGSSMDVDDISLVYSSKVQKIYLNNGTTNKEWKGFDPNNTDEQICSLGLGVTQMPTITCVRGAGTLTNTRGGRANFPGRRLTNAECSITYGQVDGAPTVITVRAEDGSGTTTYRIKFVSTASNNARLADIRVNGELVNGFNPYLTNYNVALPYGTTEVPVVTANPQDATATVSINPAASTTGTATIQVTAGDGTSKQTYTVAFSVAPLTDVTLQAIYLDGGLLPGFQPSKSNYTVSLPLGTTTAPAVTWQSAYPAGKQTIQLLQNTLEQGAQIQVSIPGSTLSKTYKITYKIEASSYSYLAGISLDGEPLADFAPEKTVYTVTLPLGTTTLPNITCSKGDNYQTVEMTEGGVDGTTRIVVTAASGAKTTYRLIFQTEKSTNNALAGIAIDGQPLENYHPDSLAYKISLPAGTKNLPTVSYTQGDSYQQVVMAINQAQMTVRLTVTAGDGSTRVYLLAFEVEKSANALLQMIYLDGNELEGFTAEKLDYSLLWNSTTMPAVTVLANEGQKIAISMPATYGTARIVVTPEEGTPNIYTVRFSSPDQVVIPAFPMDSFPASHDATLAALYIGGELYEAFNPNTTTYDYPLPWRTYQVPAVMPVAAKLGQTITVEHGAVNRPTLVKVLAEDKSTSKTYTINFTVAKSSNTNLASVEIDGVNFSFDPATKTYTGLVLPYGTTQAPVITAERAEPEQSLVITEAPLGQPSTITVTAEDGSQATYSFSYQVALPGLPNELTAIVLDGIGALDMTLGPDFTIDLPFGTTAMDVVSVAKKYPEQEVRIINGGVLEPTIIKVKSLDPSEADKVYTLTPNVYPYDPAQLLDIQVGGVSIAQFQPDVYNYVLSVENTPAVTYTAQAGADVDVDSNPKWVKLTVEAGDESEYHHTYLITFFYPGDITFDMDFEEWIQFTNEDASKTGKYPRGWYAPINAETSGSKGSYEPQQCSDQTTTHTHGSYAAKLATAYLLTSGESMPGFLSLAEPTVTVGAFAIATHIASSLSYGDAIPFRNSPDHVSIDYNLQSYQNVKGWRFVYDANGLAQVKDTMLFAGMPKGVWNTLSRTLTYPADYVPMTLNILISAGQTEKLDTYYVGDWFSGLNTNNRHLSQMYFDNLRLNYSSALSGLNVNGVAATIDGTNISATVDADSYGTPALAFSHAVADQMPVVTWEEENNGVRTATIRNYAEDLSYTDYTLTVTRPKSTNTAIAYTLSGMDLKVTKGSPYQTITIGKNDTAYVIGVTAESGAQQLYYAAWEKSTGSTAVTNVPAEDPIVGSSTARLVNLEEMPVVSYSREFALDSVVMVTTDTIHYLHVFGSGAALDTTYIIHRNPSDNALLASITTNSVQVPDFYGETYDYVVSLASLDQFSATAQDPDADVQYTTVKIDDENIVVFVLVKAADGKSQARYSVLAQLHTPATDAYLTSITADEVALPDFQTTKYNYTISLPTGSAIPTMASVVCEGATVEMTTVQQGSSATITFVVTSEDGQTHNTYTVLVDVLPSDICTLADLLVGGESIATFQPEQYQYNIELPHGTTTLPEVDYILFDSNSSAHEQTAGQTVSVVVTAEDGVHSNTYSITFTIAKSTNANLASIGLDGEPLASFFADDESYEISLPYGAQTPVITAEAEDPASTVAISGNTITVTAEDGVTTRTYTLSFTWLPSSNSDLLSILLNNIPQNGFDPSEYSYRDTVLYGAAMPEISWITADDQQQVDTTWVDDTELTILVTAGDGTTSSEYTLTFVHLLSSNWHLADLLVNGVTIAGFDADLLEYEVLYPVGTDSTALLDATAISAVPQDPDATLTITMEDGVIQIFVTAPDGTIGVYTIEQTIMLSSEAHLEMIWLNGEEVRNYDRETLNYTIIIAQGAQVPEITAVPVDTLASWELGMETVIENGKRVEIYCTAEDGTTIVYVLDFVYAEWAASSVVDTDDYIFLYAGGGQYKAVSIGIGIQVGIYDLNGHRLMLQEVPVADPADVVVEIDEKGNQILVDALPSAAGAYFQARPEHIYFYVFFDSKTKKIAKGGKFMLR